ncbi:hypothetical protein TNCV_2547261 [Trichonephila clavipes]|nr:hypothetical protein TNCV_2547261 [Trichonephila clavipes]
MFELLTESCNSHLDPHVTATFSTLEHRACYIGTSVRNGSFEARMGGQWQISVSIMTLHRRLIERNLSSYRQLLHLPLMPSNCRARLQWCLARSEYKATPHVASVAMNYLTVFKTLLWPVRPPNISPTQHVWDMVGKRLHLPWNVNDQANNWSKFAVPLHLVRSNSWEAQLVVPNDSRYAGLETNLEIKEARAI